MFAFSYVDSTDLQLNYQRQSAPPRQHSTQRMGLSHVRLIATHRGMRHDSRSALTNSPIVCVFLPLHFADREVSEYGYGIALINESKYGYAVQGNVMRLSLLRSPLRPDPNCDRGQQVFSFAIYPHTGVYVDSDVQVVAHAFNSPLYGTYRCYRSG